MHPVPNILPILLVKVLLLAVVIATLSQGWNARLLMAPGTTMLLPRQTRLIQQITLLMPKRIFVHLAGDYQALAKSLQPLPTKQRLAQLQAATTTAVRLTIPGAGTGGLTARLAVLIAGTRATVVLTCIRLTVVVTSGSTSVASATPKTTFQKQIYVSSTFMV